jgi:hypothetical protein
MSVTLVDTITYKKLVTAANSKLYYEASVGTMTELSTASYTIDTTDQLNMFEAFQKVFVVNGSKLGVADFINTKISTSDIAPTDKSAPIKGTLLTYDGDPDATMVVDYVTAADGAADIYGYVTSGTIPSTAVVLTGTNESGTPTAVSFTKTAVAPVSNPHWYQWTVYPSASGTDFGIMPVKAYLGCLYRGRGVLAGNPNYPNQWYMSRIANLYDWNFSATDAMSPCMGNDADAGEIGDIIRSLTPYKDDILIFGCASSMWYMRGDPLSGGSIDSFDLTVGIFGANSWCIDNEGSFFFWGTGGIYVSRIEGGVITKPELLTGVLLPNIVNDEGADPSTHRICMGYDRKRLGIVITITKLSDGTNKNYWYDLRTKGFFPETYPTSSGAYSVFNYQANDPDYADLLVGCKDGYIRRFSDSLKSDNTTADAIDVGTTAINSYCSIVTPLGNTEDLEGKLNSLTITTAGGASGGDFSDTDSVNYELHRGNNGETVLEDIIDGATAQETGSIVTTGRQNRIRKKVRGAYLGIKLYNSTVDLSWAIEKITGDVTPCGRVK